ncbi:hypothetical protein B0H10DRAFT_2229664 [Mycena sp. CBHHK59/15]|nr:hypothetical protein B0H10DRAFT_2229664 [Mycena sp. CBHHK59/15]
MSIALLVGILGPPASAPYPRATHPRTLPLLYIAASPPPAPSYSPAHPPSPPPTQPRTLARPAPLRHAHAPPRARVPAPKARCDFETTPSSAWCDSGTSSTEA